MATTPRRIIAVIGCVTASLGLVACGSGEHPRTAPRSTPSASASASATAPAAPTSVSATATPTSPTPRPSTRPAPRIQKVLVVIEENHSYAQMRDGMPFLATLSDRYGYATHWTALTHPSLPNYLGIAAGTTFGIQDDHPPADHTSDIGSAASVFDQAIAAGRTAGTYAETMPARCGTDNSASYAVRHNPWAYFGHDRQDCLVHDQDLTTFAGDAARNALPDVAFLIPDLDHDAHDGSLATADAWLEQRLTPVLGSRDFTSGKLVVVVTADEDDKHSGNVVLTSVLTPRISHAVVRTPLTHYSLTRFIAQVLGVTPLRNGANAPDLKAAFGL